MNKIIEFISNHDKAVSVFLNVVLIILGFCYMGNMISNGFTAEQLDEPSLLFGIVFVFIFDSFLRIFDILFYKPKSDKE